jgi:hypothetical protein
VAAVDALRASIDAPRAPALAREIDAQLAATVSGLPQPEREACRTKGRGLELTAALALAISICEGA